jgi:small-conductance mechanosensitive channel
VNHRPDPVRARRQLVAKWTLLANRVGYLFYAVAIAVFIFGFAIGFTGALVGIVVTGLVVGSILLAPAIVLGYAVKAAERDDRARGF